MNRRRVVLVLLAGAAVPLVGIAVALLISSAFRPDFELASREIPGREGQMALTVDASASMTGGLATRRPDRDRLDAQSEKDVAGSASAGELPQRPDDARKVVYTGRFQLLVSDVHRAQDRLKQMAEEMGGYMQELSGSSMVVRVPAGRFEEAVGRLGDLGSVTDRHINAQDVTEQYYDLSIRVKNARALVESLRALLKDADQAEERRKLTVELADAVTELERLEGQLSRLSNRIAFATITVDFQRFEEAPQAELRVRLPFAWVHDLGLDNLLNFEGRY
jgi:hypothetical protein